MKTNSISLLHEYLVGIRHFMFEKKGVFQTIKLTLIGLVIILLALFFNTTFILASEGASYRITIPLIASAVLLLIFFIFITAFMIPLRIVLATNPHPSLIKEMKSALSKFTDFVKIVIFESIIYLALIMLIALGFYIIKPDYFILNSGVTSGILTVLEVIAVGVIIIGIILWTLPFMTYASGIQGSFLSFVKRSVRISLKGTYGFISIWIANALMGIIFVMIIGKLLGFKGISGIGSMILITYISSSLTLAYYKVLMNFYRNLDRTTK